MKTIFKVIMCFSFLASTFNLKAQADSISGIYVDGVKVTEIDCYSFGNMEVKIPYNVIWDEFKDGLFLFAVISDKKEFPEISKEAIDKSLKNFDRHFRKEIEIQELKIKYVKNNYFNYKLYLKDQQDPNGTTFSGVSSELLTRSSLAHFNPKMRKEYEKADSAFFHIGFFGRKISHYVEYFDSACNCLKKEPKYISTPVIGEWITFKIKNRKLAKYNNWNVSFPLVDLTQPCIK